MPETNEFELKIDFVRGEGDPKRVFKAMYELIEACESADAMLLRGVPASIRASFVLDDVQSGSLVSILRQAVTIVPDKVLETGEIKKIVGCYLVEAKRLLVQWCKKRESLATRVDLEDLTLKLKAVEEESGIKRLTTFSPLAVADLVNGLEDIERALSNLEPDDHAYFSSEGQTEEFNKGFHVDREHIRGIFTQKIVSLAVETSLIVESLDYSGSSVWEFRFEGKRITARILDEKWLASFKTRRVHVRPGDKLLVTMRVNIHYGHDEEVVATDYEVIKLRRRLPWLSH